MQKLSGYQIKVISVFSVSVSDVKYLRECPEPQWFLMSHFNLFFFFFEITQLLKDFKHDQEFHYVTIKSETLTSFQSKHVCPLVNPSIHPSFHARMHPSIQKWVRIDHRIVISYPVELGTKWPKWVRNGCYWVRNDQSRYEMTWVQNDWQPPWQQKAPIDLKWGKWCLHLFSVAFDLNLFIIAGNDDIHKISDEFEFRPDRTTDYGVSCPWASKKFPIDL